jgi:hypothetical protein
LNLSFTVQLRVVQQAKDDDGLADPAHLQQQWQRQRSKTLDHAAELLWLMWVVRQAKDK